MAAGGTNSANQATAISWSRDEISSCNCDEKPFTHVHCKCWNCRGRAMHRSAELRHWREACVSSTCRFANESQGLTNAKVWKGLLLKLKLAEST